MTEPPRESGAPHPKAKTHFSCSPLYRRACCWHVLGDIQTGGLDLVADPDARGSGNQTPGVWGVPRSRREEVDAEGSMLHPGVQRIRKAPFRGRPVQTGCSEVSPKCHNGK
jgi:hypothetical protein